MAVAATGCTTTDHLYSQGRCLTCINNPITGEAINYDPEQQVDQQVAGAAEQGQQAQVVAAGGARGQFGIESPLDVDTAYARLRGEFGFRSDADFNPNSNNDQWEMMDSAWHFDATPGAFYRLSDYARQIIDGVEHRIVLQAQIERNGSGSRIRMEFGPSGNASYTADAMEAALRERVASVLR